MQPIVANVAALAVASLFYFWRSHQQTLQRRQHVLYERVAYMLWVMAQRYNDSDSA